MATKLFGEQRDIMSAANERDVLQNYAFTTGTAGFFRGARLVDLPYSRRKMEFRALPGSQSYFYHYNEYNSGQVQAPHMSNVVDSSLIDGLHNNSRISAVANLFERMRGSKFNLGVTMVEGKKTVALITDTASRILNAYRAVRKGRFTTAADILFMDKPSRRARRTMKKEMSRGAKGLANNWLKYRYGVRPLIWDVYSGIEAYSAIAATRFDDIVYTGFNSDSDSSSNSNGSTTAVLQHSFSVKAQVQGPDARIFSSVGLDNPALIAWELIPFSFMFDWFIPVGTWLESMKAPSGFSFTGGCEGTKTIVNSEYSGATGFSSGNSWQGGWKVTTGAKATYSEENFDRKTLTSFPNTSSTPPTPKSLSKALNLSKAIDVVSIITNLKFK